VGAGAQDGGGHGSILHGFAILLLRFNLSDWELLRLNE
jgi:hypothetical protein